jgi:hypothetical protein
MGPQVLPDSTSGTERTVRFYVNGGGPAPDGLPLVPGETAPHSATGTATHLGAYTGSGTFQLGSLQISATGHVTATFQGSFVFVAANGDQLAVNYGVGDTGVFTGQVSADGTTLLNGRFVATFTPDPAHSTGRFADVVGGGFEMIASAPSVSLISTMPGYSAPFDYTWRGHGALVFQSPGTSSVLAASHLGRQQASVRPKLAAAPARVQPDATSGSDRTVRFKLTGGGPAPDGLPLVPGETAPHSATGTATHLGAYTGSGTFQLGSLQISATGQVTATFQGTFVFVAANGDQLACNYGVGDSGVFTGQLSADGTTLMNGRFVATFTPDPTHSTGRFADVVGGGFEMIATAPSVSLISTMPGYSAPFNYTWRGEGALEFRK